jgi:hypothetical protein
MCTDKSTGSVAGAPLRTTLRAPVIEVTIRAKPLRSSGNANPLWARNGQRLSKNDKHVEEKIEKESRANADALREDGNRAETFGT